MRHATVGSKDSDQRPGKVTVTTFLFFFILLDQLCKNLPPSKLAKAHKCSISYALQLVSLQKSVVVI